jgi:hypothetical protein
MQYFRLKKIEEELKHTEKDEEALDEALNHIYNSGGPQWYCGLHPAVKDAIAQGIKRALEAATNKANKLRNTELGG